MAGAMRRMGIYLGLVEDDDPRGYGRYDSRQSDHADYDRRYGRYSDDHYDGVYAADGYVDDDVEAEGLPAARVQVDHPGAGELSAGMSGDLEAAVAAGATIVRVGTALFGDRPLASG